MAGYSPLKITGNSTGLVEEREEFLLPDDAYPILQNAYVWRERIKRKKGYSLLGRLQRNIGTTDGVGNLTVTIDPQPIQSGIASFVIGTDLFNDPGGASPVNLLTNGSGTATLNRATGQLVITGSIALTDVQYFPGLPVMGIRRREVANSANDETIFFDQDYAYVFNSGTNEFEEFIPGTTWNAGAETVSGTSFFWSTNYWVSSQILTNPPAYTTQFTTTNRKLFWVTNNTGFEGTNADPPRITDGVSWVDFYHDTTPNINSPWAQIDSNPTYLTNWLCNLPYRGRMVVFNTWEGPTAASSQNFSNRIRWSTIGNPFIPYADAVIGPPFVPAKGSWRDDIRGQGGFLDIPTSEDIISIGYVRDNLVIYCERSTWQLRYTGRSIAPFQIEKVNSELGVQGPFATIQFDTSLLGIGDRGIVECDSYKSEKIDVKIPDFVWKFYNLNDGTFRVHGLRDFQNRLAYWTIPYASSYSSKITPIFPNQRLIYNYENDSWALFNDSLTTLGFYQPTSSRTWLNTNKPWIECNFPWIDQPAEVEEIVAGNQQGFIEYLNQQTVNDVSLFITNIVGHTTTPTIVTSPNHNMNTGFVIGIRGIASGDPYESLNGGIFSIIVNDSNSFQLMKYNSTSMQFSTPQLDVPSGPYTGGGLIYIRENFSIYSKKFNFLDEGQSIQFGYLDILMDSTEKDNPGAITLNVYLDYDDINSSNTLPKNQINGVVPPAADTFFNSVIPTSPSTFAVAPQGTKFWQRVICPTRANFITLQYTLSNAQMAGNEQTKDVQIDAQILWIRKAGRLSQF